MTQTLHFNCDQQRELLGLVDILMAKVEDALQKADNLKTLNGKLLERLHSKTADFQQEFGIMVDLIVKNQIDYEDHLYEMCLVSRIRGGFMHEAPF